MGRGGGGATGFTSGVETVPGGGVALAVAVVGPPTARCPRTRLTILRPMPLMRTSSSTVRNGCLFRYARMACAFDGPIPGNNASTSAGAVFRLMAPSTALPARAGRVPKPTKTKLTTRNATRACTAIVVVRRRRRLLATYGASALGAQTLAMAVGLWASSIMPGDWATDIIVEIPVEATG